MANIGMMEGAYFVGRVELLNWLNDLLKLDYTKVEQTCTGAAHCQIMDAIYPGKVPLSKVNFNAKHEYEWVNNFKVLQNAFDKLQIEKFIDVAKLTKGKYQDNLEFLQWIKRYFDLNYSGGEYNAVERRAQAASGKVTSTGGSSVPKKTTAAPAPAKKAVTEAPKKAVTTAPKPATKTATTATSSATKPKPTATPKTPSGGSDDSKVNELNTTIAELRVTIDGLEKERDFYFSKLRDVEIMCQTATTDGTSLEDLMPKIFKVLYATDESEEFVPEGETATEEVVEETPAEEETF